MVFLHGWEGGEVCVCVCVYMYKYVGEGGSGGIAATQYAGTPERDGGRACYKQHITAHYTDWGSNVKRQSPEFQND